MELVVALVTVLVTVLVARFFPRWPAMLTGLASGFAAAAASAALGGPGYVQMGSIPSIIPPLSLPDFDLEKLSQVVGLSLALAVVALGQSISIAKAIADRSGQHIDANREFFGQGLANVAASFSSSYLSCGSLNRSMPNFEAGARTPLAAVASALILLVLVALSERLLERLPMATIAALLLYVAWTLINIPRIRETLQFNMQEAACMVVTWGAVLVTRIELAILIGMGLSLIFYLYQTSRPAMRVLVPVPQGRRFTPLTELDQVEPECPQLKLVRMEGSVYFGATQQVSDTLRRYRERAPKQKHLLVMVKSMNFIDQAGARVWEHEDDVRRKMGGALYFHRPRARVVAVWERTGFLERLGKDRVFDSKHDALASIVPSLDPQICARCSARIFLECPGEGTPCVQPRCG
jgi:SulP family sulfate permease